MNDYGNLECVLQRVNHFTTLKKNDRQKYTEDFNRVRDFLLHKMIKIDANFRSLYHGPNLGGSYADNLKVSKPDEFDLVFHLRPPNYQLIDVSRDPARPGNVLININLLLQKIRMERHNQELYTQLCKFIDINGYLVPARLQSWIEGLVTKVLGNCCKYKCCNEEYQMYYVKTGPAHTIKVTQGSRPFSIDFVPGLLFDESKWPAQRNCPFYAKHTNWIAVPKPIIGYRENLSFQSSFVDTEREIIRGKYNLKNCLRLFKKIRDQRNIQNMKSYYIKTVFLWEDDVQPPGFWETHSLSQIFMHMFEKILLVLSAEKLPFFWDKNCDMFANFTAEQKKTMYHQWNAAYRHVLRYKDSEPKLIFDLFLTTQERVRMDLIQYRVHPIEEGWSCAIC